MTTAVMDLENIQAAKVIDARSSACPGPLLEAKKGIGAVKVGQVLEIWSGSQDTRMNLTRWCKKTGNEFLGFVDEGAYDRLFILRKK
jgi:tRNA 2-thiouridine synthesizing protein A